MRTVEEDSPIKASELDYEGHLFGVVRKGSLIHLYMEDDTNWYYKLSFHQEWLPDLYRMLKNISKPLELE